MAYGGSLEFSLGSFSGTFSEGSSILCNKITALNYVRLVESVGGGHEIRKRRVLTEKLRGWARLVFAIVGRNSGRVQTGDAENEDRDEILRYSDVDWSVFVS